MWSQLKSLIFSLYTLSNTKIKYCIIQCYFFDRNEREREDKKESFKLLQTSHGIKFQVISRKRCTADKNLRERSRRRIWYIPVQCSTMQYNVVQRCFRGFYVFFSTFLMCMKMSTTQHTGSCLLGEFLLNKLSILLSYL